MTSTIARTARELLEPLLGAAFDRVEFESARRELGLALFFLGAPDIGFPFRDVCDELGQRFGIPVAPVILGVVTAIGGGLIRDVLAGHRTLLMNRDLYAITVTLGCVLYVLSLAYLPEHGLLSAILCMAIIFGFRAAVIHWKLCVPEWLMTRHRDD